MALARELASHAGLERDRERESVFAQFGAGHDAENGTEDGHGLDSRFRGQTDSYPMIFKLESTALYAKDGTEKAGVLPQSTDNEELVISGRR